MERIHTSQRRHHERPPHSTVGNLALCPAAPIAEAVELSDDQLIEQIRSAPPERSAAHLEALFERYYEKVSAWCLRYCRDRDRAADLVQETFLRVHTRLDSFRMESRFSTWLYQVTRSVAINRGLANNRRRSRFVESESCPEAIDPSPSVDTTLHEKRMSARMKALLADHLTDLEIKILYLHYVHSMTLPAIAEHLGLENKSGAKAYVVSAKRKLRRLERSELDVHLAEVVALR